jgi:hypothetical protein
MWQGQPLPIMLVQPCPGQGARDVRCFESSVPKVAVDKMLAPEVVVDKTLQRMTLQSFETRNIGFDHFRGVNTQAG